jgi:hypothetical protein
MIATLTVIIVEISSAFMKKIAKIVRSIANIDDVTVIYTKEMKKVTNRTN